MIKIAICDDEKNFIYLLEGYVRKYLAKKQAEYVIDSYGSGKELVELGVGINEYQVIFLDINMEELDGMETARIIRDINENTIIVFVTAFINYTLDGYKVNALRYLLKDSENFEESIEECMDAIWKRLDSSNTIKTVDFQQGERTFSLHKLLYIESRLHKLEFHFFEDKTGNYTIYGTLNNIEQEYLACGFIRLHQSYLVNLKHIRNVRSFHAILTDGTKLPIPKARYEMVWEAFVATKGEF